MRGGILFLCVLLTSTLMAQAPPLFIELQLSKRLLFVGETADCVLRVGYDEDHVREHLLPVVQRRTNLPLLLRTPFATPPVPAWQWLPMETSATGPTLAMDDAVVNVTEAAAVVRSGQRYRVVEIARRFRVTEPGRVTLPPARLHSASATSFSVDFLGTRTARDKTEHELSTPSLECEVLPPPTLGRPAEFRGAIGRYSLNASANATSAHVGDTITLDVLIEGPALHADFTPPSLSSERAFHLLGTRTEQSTGRMKVHYELQVLDTSANTLPACELVSFDPDSDPPRYLRSAAPRLAIRLLPAKAGVTETAPSVASSIRDDASVSLLPTDANAPADATPPPPAWAITALILAPFGIAAGVGVRRIAAARRRADGGRRAAQRATAQAQRALARGADPGTAFLHWLSTRLRLTPAAVLEPELREVMHSARLSPELVARVQRVVERVLAARYGQGRAPTREDVLNLILEVDAALPPAEEPS